MLEFVIDPTWLVILAPAVALAVWARWQLGSAWAGAARRPAPGGLTGGGLAAAVLEAGGVEGVSVARADGPLANFYDSGRRVLRLSGPVVEGGSLAALGRSAYEAGHAARDGLDARPGRVRRLLALTSGLGATAAWLTMLAGLTLAFLHLFVAGTVLLWVALLAALAEVPLGLDAARRARRVLPSLVELDADQGRAVEAVLAAAPWTRVAAILPIPCLCDRAHL